MPSETDNPRVYNGAYGLCRDPSSHLLLVRITDGLDNGLWTLPGGGIEQGESAFSISLPIPGVLRSTLSPAGPERASPWICQTPIRHGRAET